MAKPNLLLCFDAFGTLFRPKRPVVQQYGEIARQCGIGDFTDAQLQSSFRAAFKDEMRQNPNYGKSTGLGATKWWTNVIGKTFTPLVSSSQALPRELVPRLLQRFASSDGYTAEPDLSASLQALKRTRHYGEVVIGVITNSDDRVPGILSSFGVGVSPLRYGSADESSAVMARRDFDVDFHCMSYDVGVEKPDRRIFDAAKALAGEIIAARSGGGDADAQAVHEWRKVYVGDEYAKDVEGAIGAGWNPILLENPDETSPDMPMLDDFPGQPLDGIFEGGMVVRAKSVQSLAQWLSSKSS
ncbi:hypothetical protein LQW54_007120 [Pestalotiopsis sp. IQ-011]